MSGAMSRILVIDDQADVRAMIGIVLRVHHYEIVEADSVEAGLKAFEDSSFDLAIVDIFLKGTNGFDFIKMMRERIPELPIVAISGMTALDFVSSSPEFSDVVGLQKPFRPNDLVRAIEAAKASSRRRVAAATSISLSNRHRRLAHLSLWERLARSAVTPTLSQRERERASMAVRSSLITQIRKTPRRTGALLSVAASKRRAF